MSAGGRRRARGRASLGLGMSVMLVLLASGSAAQNFVFFAPDVTAELGPVVPQVVADDTFAYDDAAGSVALVPPAGLPPEVGITGAELLVGGDVLLSFDTPVTLPGLLPGMPAEPRDVVRYDAVTMLYAHVFDGSANGIPDGARIDAVAESSLGGLLLSFDTTLLLVPAGVVADEDVVRFAGGLYTLVFDGSANGIVEGLDLDGVAERPATNELLLSFDATGAAGGVVFDDEDVVAFDTGLATFAMHFDASLSDPVAWPAIDLVAVPEPASMVGLVCGVLALPLLARRRVRRA